MQPIPQTSHRLKQEGFNYCNEDRLSNLPEQLIIHILSFLPTKDAVCTCILSKAWGSRWRLIHNINIVDRMVYKNKERNKSKHFTEFVRKLFLLHCSPTIETFNLRCHREYSELFIISWLLAAIRRKAKSINVTLLGNKDRAFLPFALMESNTLKELKLKGNYGIKIPSQAIFSYLNAIEMSGVQIINQHFKQNKEEITLSFPVLEDLCFWQCRWLNTKIVNIDAPSLKKFRMGYCTFSYESQSESLGVVVKIFAGNLADFSYSGYLFEEYKLLAKSALNVASIELGIYYESGELVWVHKFAPGVWSMLQSLSQVTFLKLNHFTIKALGHLWSLPAFDQLVRLDLGRHGGVIFCETLMELLRQAPNLEHLIFNEGVSGLDRESVATGIVPSCFLTHLKHVEFREFLPRNLDAVSVMLGYAAVLEKLDIVFSRTGKDDAKTRLQRGVASQLILELPMYSPSVRISFT